MTEKQAITGNDLLAAVYLVASGDSLVTTILIGYRIYSVSNWSASSTRRFGRIVDIVVQSSALYSLALLSIGIAVVLPGSVSVLNLHFFALNAYLPILCLLISVWPISSSSRLEILMFCSGFGADYHGRQSCSPRSRYHLPLGSASAISSSIPRVVIHRPR